MTNAELRQALLSLMESNGGAWIDASYQVRMDKDGLTEIRNVKYTESNDE